MTKCILLIVYVSALLAEAIGNWFASKDVFRMVKVRPGLLEPQQPEDGRSLAVRSPSEWVPP